MSIRAKNTGFENPQLNPHTRSPQTKSKFLARKLGKRCRNEENYQQCEKGQTVTDFNSKAVAIRECE